MVRKPCNPHSSNFANTRRPCDCSQDDINQLLDDFPRGYHPYRLRPRVLRPRTLWKDGEIHPLSYEGRFVRGFTCFGHCQARQNVRSLID